MFTQRNTIIRQSNAPAIFSAFGTTIKLGDLEGTGDAGAAPREIPAGTEVTTVAMVSTADHYNLMLVGVKLPDGTVAGMALRPKPFQKLIGLTGTTAPDPADLDDEGVEELIDELIKDDFGMDIEIS